MSDETERRRFAVIMFAEIVGYPDASRAQRQVLHVLGRRLVGALSYKLQSACSRQGVVSSRFSPKTYSITPPPRQISLS